MRMLRVTLLAAAAAAGQMIANDARAEPQWFNPNPIANGFYFGAQGSVAWGTADMTHPFPAAAVDADLRGGTVGIFGGTPCYPNPFVAFKVSQAWGRWDSNQLCVRAEASFNVGSISGTGGPNFGGEFNTSKISSFGTLNAQVLFPAIGGAVPIIPPGSRFFVGAGPAFGNVSTSFAGFNTSDTVFGWNAQAGVIVPINASAAARINVFVMNLGSMTIPTFAGPGKTDFWAQGLNFGLEFRY
jgi:hypothetical protein